jgi:Bacterial PH domain
MGTWVDDAGLRLRGMFRTHAVPWSHVRYIQAGPNGRKWAVEAGLADGKVMLPGTVGQPDRAKQFAADLTADNPGQQWLAIGLDLTAIPAEGSPQTPLLVTESLHYRANWGLPGMTGKTGAPLLCSSAFTLAPGDSARAVIIPLTDAHLSEWRLLGPGDRLRLFDGPRVCGHAVVRWSESTSLPVPSTDTDRFSIWVNSGDDLPDLHNPAPKGCPLLPGTAAAWLPEQGDVSVAGEPGSFMEPPGANLGPASPRMPMLDVARRL